MAKRGRPQFKATPARRRKVEELVSCGMSADDVARVIGCSTPTIEKHFPDELATGRAKKRAEVIGLLYRAARKGNVSAQKKLEDMTGLAATARPAPSTKPAKERPLGKKQEELAAAQSPDASTPMGELMARRAAETKLH